MLNAHVKSMSLLATPFRASTPQPFSFAPGSSWASITAEIRSQIPVMLQHRLTPPPRETYSLNRFVSSIFTCAAGFLKLRVLIRKLSGAFLLAARLNAQVDCFDLWDSVVRNYRFGQP